MKALIFAFLYFTLLCSGYSAFADLPGPPPGAPSASLSFLPGESVDDASGAPSVPGPFVALTDTTKPTVPNVVFYSFGTISNARTSPIQHDFLFRNSGRSYLSIDHLQPGCGCVSASFAPLTRSRIIAPGIVFKVHVSIDTKQLYLGKINKIVWIFLAGQSSPAYTMHVTGETIPMATFIPSGLDLGNIRFGSKTVEKITVETDSSVYGLNPASPMCLGGTFKVDRDTAAPKRIGSLLERTYNVSLIPLVHLGMVSDLIMMPVKNDPKRQGPSLLITANVFGDISALPESIEFGAASRGQILVHEVDLSWSSPRMLRGLTLVSGDRTVSLALTQVKPTSAVLRVFFCPKSSGALQTTVTVKSSIGQQLVLPVLAWVN